MLMCYLQYRVSIYFTNRMTLLWFFGMGRHQTNMALPRSVQERNVNRHFHAINDKIQINQSFNILNF